MLKQVGDYLNDLLVMSWFTISLVRLIDHNLIDFV